MQARMRRMKLIPRLRKELPTMKGENGFWLLNVGFIFVTGDLIDVDVRIPYTIRDEQLVCHILKKAADGIMSAIVNSARWEQGQ